MPGHEIDERCGSFGALEACFEDQRLGLIFPCYPGGVVLCGNEPTAVFRRTEESRETGIRIEPWPTQPINGTIATDQRGCLAVTDKRVVFNPQRHAITL